MAGMPLRCLLSPVLSSSGGEGEGSQALPLAVSGNSTSALVWCKHNGRDAVKMPPLSSSGREGEALQALPLAVSGNTTGALVWCKHNGRDAVKMPPLPRPLLQ